MKKVLILIPYFKPGYRSGGPQRTIENVCNAYKSNAKIYIVTQNYDLGTANKPYDLKIGKWYDLDGVKIMYMRHQDYNPIGLKKLYQRFDIIYSCGLFEINTISTLLLNRVYYKKNKKVYIAPMGVFSPGAFNSKKKKKHAFIELIKLFGLYKNIIWSFTSDGEYADAVSTFGGSRYIRNYIVAEDLPSLVDFSKSIQYLDNSVESNALKIVFLSRICPQKNLLFAIKVLKDIKVKRKVEFDIYGIIEDKLYWNECQKEMTIMPENVMVKYKGEVRPDEVIDVFRKYDLFLFPTKGENYGHVIYESMAAGCIPIISDQTPWNDLNENKCGETLPLNKPKLFTEFIDNYCSITNDVLFDYKKKCITYANNKREKAVEKSGYKTIFEK